jgi:hypothetical protein
MRYHTLRSSITRNLATPAQATWPRGVDPPAVPAGYRANAGPRRTVPPAVGERRGEQLLWQQALGNCPQCLGIGCNDCCHTGR